MKSAADIRKEHKAVRGILAKLIRDGKDAGYEGQPLPKDKQLYLEIDAIRLTLEWVYPALVKHAERGTYRHLLAGPLHATLYP